MSRYFRINNLFRFVFYLVAVLPIFIFRDFTPDNELRYLSIADEALRNGSLFTFTNHGLIYADKPPLYLWIVMIGKIIFGTHNMLFLGLFSIIPALVIVFVMDRWVMNVLSEKDRIVAQLMLLTSGFFIGTAIVLRMDMLMAMFIVLALYTFFRMYSGEGKPRDSMFFPVFVFMALFSKGPVGIIVPLVSTVVFLFLKKDLKTIGHYWGWKSLILLISLSGFWFAGVYAEGGKEYLNNLLFNQTVNRAVNSFHHQEPFYFYLMTFWYSLAPWSLLVFGILFTGLKNRLVSTDLERFFLVIAGSTFVILSLFSSKLAVYMLPTFPFLIYLPVLLFRKLNTPRWMYILVLIPAGILCLVLPGILVAPHFLSIPGFSMTNLLMLAAIILSSSGVTAIWLLAKHQLKNGIIAMSSGMLIAVFVFSFGLPKYNGMIGLRELTFQAKKPQLNWAV
ncbi:MAG: glycosyltransferase family 39 protein [Prolixibacteraceae bacterium]